MDETAEESIQDDVRSNCWWTKSMKDYPYQMMRKTTADGRGDDGMHTRWCTKHLLVYETNEGLPIVDGIQNNSWWMREMKAFIPFDVRNNCWWMGQMKDYPYQMVYKTTVGGREGLRNPYRMMYEITVDEWDQWMTTHTRWCTKQLLMDKTSEGLPRWYTKERLVDKSDQEFHSRLCKKQLLMDDTNEGLLLSIDVQNNSWWTRGIKESISDGVRNNCSWMRAMKDYPYQMMYTTTVDEWAMK